jgi:hypothetical protein
MKECTLKHICLFLMAFLPLTITAQVKIDSVNVEAKIRTKVNNISTYGKWQKFPSRTVTLLTTLPTKAIPTNVYGSDLRLKSKRTGFFRTEKIDGKWWTIDPDGYAGLQIAVNSINQGKSDRNQQNFQSVYGNEKQWIQSTGKLLVDNGFNAAGSWSETDAIQQYNKSASKPISYTVMLNFMSSYGSKRGGTRQEAGHRGYPNNTIFVFDPAFENHCDQLASELVKYKDDKNLFGYFTDNELPFNIKNLEDYLSLPNKKDFGHLAAKKWLADNNIKQEEITTQNKADFLGFVADTYFSIVTKSIRKHDPNHLSLGSRFYSSEKNVKEFMQAAGKYLDVISVNYYNTWTPSQTSMVKWEKWSGKPLLITEFYVKAEDTGLGNLSGAGWLVKNQQDRGLFYQNYCLSLLQSKSCIGWHWFKYQDNDPTYTKADPSNNDANKGIVDNEYRVYQSLLDEMKKLNTNRFQLIELLNKLSND